MLLITQYLIGVFITFITLYGYGSTFIKNGDLFYTSLVGYIVVGIISITIHFFSPINEIVSLITIFLGIVLFLFNFKKNKIFLGILFLPFISLILIGYSEHPIDANLYHHPYISYLINEKIIFGIANIHSRFGHISFLQFAQSILTNDFLTIFSISNINIIFYFCFVYYCQNIIFNNNNNNFVLITTSLVSSFILIKFARYREFGNDLIPFLVANYFLINLIALNTGSKFYSIINKSNITSYSPIFFFFMLSHKISYVFSSLIFFNINFKESFFNKKFLLFFIISLILILLWLIKNYLETACLIYPITQTCFSQVEWILFGEADPNFAKINAEAWSKGWIDRPKDLLISMSDYNNSLTWISVWFSKHFFKILEMLSPLLLLILIIKIIFFKSEKDIKKEILNIKFKNFLWQIFFLNLIGILIWFFNAPIFRYGAFYITTFIIIFYLIYDFDVIKKLKLRNKLKYIFLLSFIFFISKNIERQLDSNSDFFPKTKPKPEQYELVSDKKIKLIKSKKELNACYVTEFICSNMIPKEIHISEYNGYLYFKSD